MAEPSPISRWKIPIVQDMSDGSGGSRLKERGVQRPSAHQPLASASLQRRWGPAPRGVTPPRVGEADHAPPASVGRGGAAIFGTVPGARLNTIKVRRRWRSTHLSPTSLQTSFILGDQAGRLERTGGGGGGQRSALPLPATMLCCGGKKVRRPLISRLCFHLLCLDHVISLQICNLQFNQLFYFVLYLLWWENSRVVHF